MTQDWRKFFNEDSSDKDEKGLIIFFGDSSKVDLIPEDRLAYTCIVVDDTTGDALIWSFSKRIWSNL
jgi:hypothetical protein